MTNICYFEIAIILMVITVIIVVVDLLHARHCAEDLHTLSIWSSKQLKNFNSGKWNASKECYEDSKGVMIWLGSNLTNSKACIYNSSSKQNLNTCNYTCKI